jgi:hypothetical protein
MLTNSPLVGESGPKANDRFHLKAALRHLANLGRFDNRKTSAIHILAPQTNFMLRFALRYVNECS